MIRHVLLLPTAAPATTPAVAQITNFSQDVMTFADPVWEPRWSPN